MDRDCFDRLLLDHLAAAQRFAIRLCGDVHWAEDLLHDAILRGMNNAENFRGQSRFTTWLFQIIVNSFRDSLRKKGVEEIEENLADVRAIDPSAATHADEIARLIAARVSALPPRQREVLVLIAYEQMSVEETASILRISEQNVRANLSYARARLRSELSGYL